MWSKRVHWPLLLGDWAVLLLFTALGMAQHLTGPTFLSVIVTGAPFLIAWTFVAFWLGTLRRGTIARLGLALKAIIVPWLLAMPLAMQLRVLLLQRGAPREFAVIALIVGGVFLALWRGVYAVGSLRRQKGPG